MMGFERLEAWARIVTESCTYIDQSLPSVQSGFGGKLLLKETGMAPMGMLCPYEIFDLHPRCSACRALMLDNFHRIASSTQPGLTRSESVFRYLNSVNGPRLAIVVCDKIPGNALILHERADVVRVLSIHCDGDINPSFTLLAPTHRGSRLRHLL